MMSTQLIVAIIIVQAACLGAVTAGAYFANEMTFITLAAITVNVAFILALYCMLPVKS